MTDSRELAAFKQRLRTDFPFFLEMLWLAIGYDKKAPLEELHLDMAAWIDNRDQPTRGVMAARGVGKTTIGTCAYAAFRLNADPDIRIMVVSEGHKHAKKIVAQIREWIRSVPFLQHLEPDPDRGHWDNADEFDVGPCTKTKDPSVRSAGIDGQITGTRAALLIADDIETGKGSRTINARERIADAVKEFRSIASFGQREILYVGTPHHRESLYERLMKQGDDKTTYAFRVYPMVLPKPLWKHRFIAPIVAEKLARHGEVRDHEYIPLFPITLGYDMVMERLSEGLVEFTRQQMCVADSEDMEYPLRLSDLIVPSCGVDMVDAPLWIKHGLRTGHNESTAWPDMEVLGMSNDRLHREIAFATERSKYASTLGFVDPSGRGNDETAWCMGGYLAGYIWTKKLGHSNVGEPGDSPTVLARIARDARESRCHRIVVERQFGGDSFGQLLDVELRRLAVEPGHPEFPDGWRCSVETVPARGNKEKRIIASLSRVMHGHRLVVPREVIEIESDVPTKYQLQYQIANITEQARSVQHDDRVEAIAGMVGLFVDEMDISPEDMAGMIEQRAKDAEIERQWELLDKQYPGVYGELQQPNWIV